MTRWPLSIGAVGAVLMMILTGCGSAPASQPKASPSPSSSPKAAPSPVKTATATVGGKSETVLTTATGMTLYYFTKDTASSSACTGICATIWPSLVVKSSSLEAPSGLTGTLSVVKDQHGDQVAYDGHLLYTYSGDSSPGQTNGEGLLHEWWVATPGLKAASAGSSGSSGGYTGAATSGTSVSTGAYTTVGSSGSPSGSGGSSSTSSSSSSGW